MLVGDSSQNYFVEKFIRKEAIHNFSQYNLSKDEHDALSYGLDQNIPGNVTRNEINTEFELFYQNIVRDVSDLPEHNIDRIRTKLRSVCEKYHNVKTRYKHRAITNNLSKNKDIIILKQDKGRGIVILNRSKYIKQCLSLLDSNQCTELYHDPTDSIKTKVQRALRKVKTKLPANIYSKVYLASSSSGKLHGTAKIHKLDTNGKVDDLPIRPITSNIGTVTYHLAKYLAQLLKPLSESQYKVKNTTEFAKKIRKQKIPKDYTMVSFDVASLFTKVPLEDTIIIILRRIYEKKEIITDIPRCEIRELLYLCTKNVQFTFNNKIYIQNDGVAMGSPLGLVLANIFTVELETALIPNFSSK